jgi:hypothetical protein
MIFESKEGASVSTPKNYGIGHPVQDNCLFRPYKQEDKQDSPKEADDNYLTSYNKMPDLT